LKKGKKKRYHKIPPGAILLAAGATVAVGATVAAGAVTLNVAKKILSSAQPSWEDSTFAPSITPTELASQFNFTFPFVP